MIGASWHLWLFSGEVVQLFQAPYVEFAASQAVGGFNGSREGSFWSERDPSETDSSQSRQDPGKEETRLVLVENQQEAAGR